LAKTTAPMDFQQIKNSTRHQSLATHNGCYAVALLKASKLLRYSPKFFIAQTGK